MLVGSHQCGELLRAVKSAAYGHIAQSGRAVRLHRIGRGFESLCVHGAYACSIMQM